MSGDTSAETAADAETAANALRAYVDGALARGAAQDIPDALLRTILTTAVKAYAAKAEATEQEFDPFEPRVISATEGATAICAMIRSIDLNMFDVSLWLNRPRVMRG